MEFIHCNECASGNHERCIKQAHDGVPCACLECQKAGRLPDRSLALDIRLRALNIIIGDER